MRNRFPFEAEFVPFIGMANTEVYIVVEGHRVSGHAMIGQIISQEKVERKIRMHARNALR